MQILAQISAGSVFSSTASCRYNKHRLAVSELYRRASSLATALQRYGIVQGNEQRVLLCVPRSPSLVIAHLAVFLAGGVIVPIDPKSPVTRILDIVEDATPACAIVANVEHAQLLAAYSHVIQIDELLQHEEATPISPEVNENRAFPWSRARHEAAYIVYTSGTTGKPKGVVVELQSLEALLAWHLNAFALTSHDCVSLTASPGFDASIWEIWGALAAGASIQICTDDERLDPVSLKKLWLENAVTHVFVSTPLIEQLLDLDWSSADVSLRFLLTGGDRLTCRPTQDLPFCIVNNYGPSEGCVVATSGPVAAQTSANALLPPDIGYPLPHMKTYILDENFRPVVQGSQGRLWIGGIALARGYLNQEALTREHFKKDPFCFDEDARIYNTGDIVSENEDGSLYYYGRDDSQVKIDGVRIELAEVEYVMCSHPQVAQAVAVVLTFPTTKTHRLVCSLVLHAEQDATAESFAAYRAYAAERLPAAAVPVDFLIQPCIPLTINGKIDRGALEKLHYEAFMTRHSATMPDDLLPGDLRILLDIWSEVLGLPVGPDADLFVAGGNSIAAARIAARVMIQFKRSCKPSHIISCRTPLATATLLPTLPLVSSELNELSTVDHGGWFPVTAMQQGLWYLWKTNMQNPFYNIGATFLLDSEMDEEKLRAALIFTLGKHPALCTRFRQNAETLEIEQKVEPFSQAELLTRIEFHPAVRDLEEAIILAKTMYRLPFHLEDGAPFRCLYVPAGSGKSVLLIVCHHIVADGLSLQIMLRDLSERYTALLMEYDLSPLQPSGADFTQFVGWQQRQARRAEALAFWTEKAEEITLCEFPGEGEHDEYESFSGGILEGCSDEGLGELLETFCREQKLSRFVVMLAAWAITITRFCSQEEVTIGIPFHGRTHPVFENLVGMFVNLVPLPVVLKQGQSYLELVKDLASDLERALEHGDLAITQIAALMRQKNSDVMGVVNTTFSEKVALTFPLSGTTSTFVEIDTGTARFDLGAFLHVKEGKIAGHIEYRTPLFARDTVVKILAAYFNVLEQALRMPSIQWELSLPKGSCLLADQSVTKDLSMQSLSLHELFEQAVSQYADTPALLTKNMRWTYEELNTYSNKLAVVLSENGIQYGDFVPLLMDRSPYMIAAILAILKLGAVYVPLDPESPVERTIQLLHIINARLIIHDTDEMLPEGPWKRVSAANILDTNEGCFTQLAYPQVKVEDAAYLMFTSGSTGTPKGVLCSHLGASLRIDWQRRRRDLFPGERVLFKTPYTFDVSVWEIFYPLSLGATLVIAEPGLQRDPLGIARLIADAHIHLCHFVPTMLQLFLDAVEKEPNLDFSSLRIIHTSGEALASRLVQRLHSFRPEVRILNLYGPTETGIEVTCYDSSVQGIAHVNIGHLLPYVSALIVDERGRAVPQGFPGELLIGGPSLALEYLENASETARAFIPISSASRAEAQDGAEERFYKTGDLVRQRNDGTLDFLGRIDTQVKIRGVRVELEEIEALLAEIAGIQEATVVVASGLATLLCFYVPAPSSDEMRYNSQLDVQRIREHLTRKLPVSLIPAMFIPLATLPLTRSGKRDRKGLAEDAREALLLQTHAQGKVPETRMELLIAAVWGQVLNQSAISCEQNFFELGGDSIKTLQIVNLLTKEGLHLSPRDLFLYPTVGQLAHYLDEGEFVSPPEEEKTFAPERDLLPLMPLQAVMLLETVKNPHSSAYWQTVAYSLPATISGERLQDAWRATVNANPALRTRIIWNAEQSGQVIEQDACYGDSEVWDWQAISQEGYTLEEWCADQLEKLKASGMQLLQKVFCIENGPDGPTGEKTTIFVWLHHHILVDGWSMAQCLNDLFQHLHDELESITPRPSLEVYCSWLENSAIERQAKKFWKQALAGIEPAETLSFEKPASMVVLGDAEPDFRTSDSVFSPRASQGLAAFCQRHRLTSSSVITFLWSLILRQYQEKDELCVGMTFANRPPQLSCSQEVSGMLINTLPVRVKWTPEMSFITGCNQVLAYIIDSSEHTSSSYSKILEYTELPALTELFKSTLVFQNFAGDLHNASDSCDVSSWQPRLLLARGTSTDPLSLTLDVRDSSIAARLGWDALHYSERAVLALVNSLHYWLERLEELGERPVGSLSLVTPQEWMTLEHGLSLPPLSAADSWCLGAYLKDAEETNSVAAYDGVKVLYYAELKKRALYLAHHLASTYDVRNGDTVAYVGTRSVEAVIAICATWLLGAAWCAIDSNFPEERQNHTLAVLKPKAVISLTSIYALTDVAPSQVDDALLNTTMDAQQTAYYISTSGSTGQPKLVVLPAAGLASIIAAWMQYYHLENGRQNVLQLGNWTSDVFLGDFLKVLATGGSLIICPDDKRVDMQYLTQLLSEWSITLVESTPVLISALMRYLAAASYRPEALQTLIVGADIFRLEELDELSKLLWDKVKLYNGYGLSECVIESVVFPCMPTNVVTGRSGLCPLGRPLPGTSLRIVNTSGNDLPPGAVGELYIGGAQVTKGYLVANGHLDDERIEVWKNIRYFKTGDLVRLGEEGWVEFFGRRDHQVKVRGHRVELGEIENAVLGYHSVREVAVIVSGSGSTLELVAFLSGQKDLQSEVPEIERRLQRLLPAYALPNRFIILSQLPRNTNGKIDRISLKKQAATRKKTQEEKLLLTTPDSVDEGGLLRQQLVIIWQRLLERPIRTTRSFFDQGGHSLLILQLYESMKQILSEDEFVVADLFRYPTIETLVTELLARRSVQKKHYRQTTKEAYKTEGNSSTLLNILQQIQRGEVSPDEALMLLKEPQARRDRV